MADPKKEEKIEKKDEETPKPALDNELTEEEIEKAAGGLQHESMSL
jgi:hypothetical protein